MREAGSPAVAEAPTGPRSPGSPVGWVRWQPAWQGALYGERGFYRRPEGPAGHFRTAAHADAPQLAAALLRLAAEHGCTAVVDVGAGRGELLTALAGIRTPGWTAPRLWGVDVVARPPRLPAEVGWSRGLDALPGAALTAALVIGWELLDVVPCPVLEVDEDGVLREVLVDPVTGRERLGDVAAGADRRWTRRWWQAGGEADGGWGEEGDRVEVGAARDRFWAALVSRALGSGAHALLAVDYAHRRGGRPACGSLTGFRAGRAVPPVPDGSMDLTAHVAIDALAAAGVAAGAGWTGLTEQGPALRDLGVRNPELLDRGGLGGFGWLVQTP